MEDRNRIQTTRRSFLIASAVGAGTLLLPKADAYAADLDPGLDGYSPETKLYVPTIQESEHEEINEQNAIALRKWADAVDQAREEGAEITTVYNPANATAPYSVKGYMAPTGYKTVGYWPHSCKLGFTASYMVNGSWVGDLLGAHSFAAGSGATVTHLYHSWTKTDAGRTLVVYYTTKVHFDMAKGDEVIGTTAHFFYTGGVNVF